MPRLPAVGGDEGNWGTILNEFLNVSHRANGTIKNVSDVLNVLDFGADKTGINPSNTAIKNAIDAIPAQGGTIFFPSGIYMISAPIIINKPGIRIVGSSMGQGAVSAAFDKPTTIKWGGSSGGTMMQIGLNNFITNMYLGHIGFDGIDRNSVIGIQIGDKNNQGYGLAFSNFKNILIQNTFKAIEIQRVCQQNHFENITIGSNVYQTPFPSGSIGLAIGSTQGSNQITSTWFGGLSITGHETAVEIGNESPSRPTCIGIKDSVFNGSGLADLRINNGFKINIKDCYFEADTTIRTPITIGNSWYPISGGNRPHGITIKGNYISGGPQTAGPINPAAFIKLRRFTGLDIINNHIGGNDGGIIFDNDISGDVALGAAGRGSDDFSGGRIYNNNYIDIPTTTEINNLSGIDIFEKLNISTGNKINSLISFKKIGVGNSIAASENLSKPVTKKIEIFDMQGNSIGFIPVYSSIS